MRIFHPIQIVRENKLYIPFAVRAALAWHDNQVLYCWARDSEPDGARNQMSISAIEPSEQQVWMLSAAFVDRPGLLARLTRFLREDGIEILTLRGSAFRQNENFGVEMLIDTRNYTRERDKGLRGLQKRLTSRFVRELLFEPDGRSQFEIAANREAGESRPPDIREPTLLNARHVTIPPVFLDRTIDDIRRRYGLPKATDLLAAVVGDTELSAVDVTFFCRHTGHKHIRLQMKNQPDALEKIAEVFSKNGFDVLQAYHRIVGHLDRCHTDLLLRYRVSAHDVMLDNELTRLIHTIVQTPALEKLDVMLTEPSFRMPTHSQSSFDLNRREIHYRQETPVPVVTLKPPAPAPRFKVFVSYSSVQKKYFKAIRSELQAVHMDVLTGFDPDPNAVDVTDTIRASVNKCAVYVGILTPDMEPAVPSQWILIEEGMAIALRKPYVLMIHEKVLKDSWSRVDATRQNYPFTDRNYKKVAKRVCERVQAICNSLAPEIVE